jgi:hypothetical protein
MQELLFTGVSKMPDLTQLPINSVVLPDVDAFASLRFRHEGNQVGELR